MGAVRRNENQNTFPWINPILPLTPTIQSSQPQTSQPHPNHRQQSLATVKIVRAELGINGKPTNMHVYNKILHINIWKEEDACVFFIQSKVREELRNDNLVLVGSSGLALTDQDGTRGILLSIWV